MIGLYKIENKINGKIYIGKSIDIERRFTSHKYTLTKNCKSYCNRYLKKSVEKYGIENFCFSVLETFDEINEIELADAEVKWMDFYDSFNSNKGYNLKRDSSTKTLISDDTKMLLSLSRQKELNSNYGNKWNEEQKKIASDTQKKRHEAGIYYTDEWRNKISLKSSELWKNEDLKKQMSIKVSKSKQKYKFHQIDKDGNHIFTWDSVEDIIRENPSYKWQNIYSVCNGYKKTYKGYKWEKELKI